MITKFNKFNILNEKNDTLYRLINKHYDIFFSNYYDNNDDNREIFNKDLETEFIQDCVNLYGENGSDEYNSGYNNSEIEENAKKIYNNTITENVNNSEKLTYEEWCVENYDDCVENYEENNDDIDYDLIDWEEIVMDYYLEYLQK